MRQALLLFAHLQDEVSKNLLLLACQIEAICNCKNRGGKRSIMNAKAQQQCLSCASMCAGALSWSQLRAVADTFKTAASGNLLLISDAAELMLKLASNANPALPYVWQACFPLHHVPACCQDRHSAVCSKDLLSMHLKE